MIKYIRTKSISILFAIFVFNTFVGCKKDDPEILPTETEIVNQFIFDITSTYYLWEEFIPASANVENYPDSYDLFDAMKYETLDHWSAVTDDYHDFQNTLDGIGKMAGYRLQMFQISGSENLYGVVELVYATSAAEQGGLKRGDIIVEIDGQSLNTQNYSELLSLDEYIIGLGQVIDNQATTSGETISIVKTELSINPILYYDVIEAQGTKIGYFAYDQFLDSYLTELENVFNYFASENIDELVLDLRYNPGGYLTTCVELASMIAPSSVLDKTFLSKQWNIALTDYFTQLYGENSEYFVTNFSQPSVNLDMNRMVVLTSEGSASASEVIMNGLNPYMDITIIGEQTAGKYTGASLFYDVEEQKHDWGIYLVINRISNSLGNTDYVNGFIPDYEIADDYSTRLGDISEPLLAKAIEHLTGIITKKSELITKKNIPYAKFYEHEFEKNGLMIVEPIVDIKRMHK